MAKQLYYQTPRNYKPGSGREVNTKPSQTVQGESYSMRELLHRYQKGLETEPARHPYFDVDDIEKINEFHAPGSLDLTDIDNLNKRVQELSEIVKEAKAKQDAHDVEPEPEPEPEPESKSDDDGVSE